jgi:GR25 family glycosyltransferase involved in LPS biosynthesis
MSMRLKKSVSKKLKVLKSPSKTCNIFGGCYNNFNVNMGVYVINCKMHVDRISKFKKYASKAGLKACRLPCVLGKKFSNKNIAKMIQDRILSKKADMTKIEVSINMSHYNAWQKMLNSCQDYCLVLEDDIEVKSSFIKNVNLILESLAENNIDFSILFLWNGNWNRTKSKQEQVLKINDKLTIMKETSHYNAGAAAYIISRKYAEFLTNPKRFFPIKMPQDMMMGKYYKQGNHLSLKMKFDKKKDCYVSPLLNMPCGGEGGTGKGTTQQHSAPTIEQLFS